MFASLALALFTPAYADENAAEACLKNKIWEGYNSGWAVRTMTTTTLAQGEHRVYLVTLYAGNEYKISACGDSELGNVDLVLYDALGNRILQDQSSDREPVLSYTPSVTDTFYIAVHATRLANPTGKGAIATAVTYK
jgi:hypothetical protein